MLLRKNLKTTFSTPTPQSSSSIIWYWWRQRGKWVLCYTMLDRTYSAQRFSFLVIFLSFYFGSCSRLRWLNCQLSSTRYITLQTQCTGPMFTILWLQPVSGRWLRNQRSPLLDGRWPWQFPFSGNMETTDALLRTVTCLWHSKTDPRQKNWKLDLQTKTTDSFYTKFYTVHVAKEVMPRNHLVFSVNTDNFYI